MEMNYKHWCFTVLKYDPHMHGNSLILRTLMVFQAMHSSEDRAGSY